MSAANGGQHNLNALLVTCEHGGNRVPANYRSLFQGQDRLLQSHLSYDPGALEVAEKIAKALTAELMVSTFSRLLIDVNRSIGNPRLYSLITRRAPPAIRQRLLEREYLPYRNRAEAWVAGEIARNRRVVHISCHSFTPRLRGQRRKVD
ncbi:MAG: N-formylglutamate amidohydrolase, partial [Burkholderiales bacterium]|nr:N-formylglutamate amidohydrolase [Burkholderiales bacterium]